MFCETEFVAVDDVDGLNVSPVAFVAFAAFK